MDQEEIDLIELGPRAEQCLFEENNDEAWSREYCIVYRHLRDGGHKYLK